MFAYAEYVRVSMDSWKHKQIRVYVATFYIYNAFILCAYVYIDMYVYKTDASTHTHLLNVFACVSAPVETFGYNNITLFHRVTTSEDYFSVVK